MWKNLSNIQKFLFIAVMCLIVPFAPEFIFLADIGGMELVFGFLVLYYKPMIIRVQSTINRIKFELEIFSIAFKNSSIFQPKVYFTQALFYSCALVVTGSVIYSSVFFLPALMLNGVLV
jgi:hypothetical protein